MSSNYKRDAESYICNLASKYPVITLTGPRQSGKTTLCRMVFGDLPYENLEHPETREFAASDPNSFLSAFSDGGVIDEFQRVPELASYIQTIVDEESFKGTFILTGSQNFVVRDTVSQSLAGRTALVELLPFSYRELKNNAKGVSVEKLLFQGFYPRIYNPGLDPVQAMADYVGTYVERDVRSLSMIRDITVFNKFIRLCAGRVGQLLNLENLGNDAGISQPTAREWLSIMEASYIAFRLPPFFRNISKRLIKTPKLYFYDVGLAAYLMGITSIEQLPSHPLRGMLFENLIVVEILKSFLNKGPVPQLSFYRDSNGNEVDLLFSHGKNIVPIEIKSAATINGSFFKGINNFQKVIAGSDNPILVYNGEENRMQQGVSICNLESMFDVLDDIAAK